MERLTYRDANGEAWYSDIGTEADRLHFIANIEDILGDDYDLDRLWELAEADRDERVVVLPCKVEDDVYINLLGRTIPLTVISISWLTETPTFKAMSGVTMCYIFKSEDVGKTVFLTREAAEEALKGEQNG